MSDELSEEINMTDERLEQARVLVVEGVSQQTVDDLAAGLLRGVIESGAVDVGEGWRCMFSREKGEVFCMAEIERSNGHWKLNLEAAKLREGVGCLERRLIFNCTGLFQWGKDKNKDILRFPRTLGEKRDRFVFDLEAPKVWLKYHRGLSDEQTVLKAAFWTIESVASELLEQGGD